MAKLSFDVELYYVGRGKMICVNSVVTNKLVKSSGNYFKGENKRTSLLSDLMC